MRLTRRIPAILCSVLLLNMSVLAMQDPKTEINALVTKNPHQICIQQILDAFHITLPLTGSDQTALQTLLSSACLTLDSQGNKDLITITDGVELIGKTTINNALIDLHVRIVNKGGKPQITIGAQVPTFTFRQISSKLQPLDQNITLSKITVIISSFKDTLPLFDITKIAPGITVQGTVNPLEPLVKQMFTDSGLDSVSLTAYVPQTATSFKDVKLSLDLNENPDTGFCPAKAITTLISSQNPDLGQQFDTIASMLCLFTDAGIAFNPDTGDMALYVSGNVNKNPAQHGMLKIWKDSSGTKFAFGAALGSINISSLLKSVQMPDFIQLQNPLLLFTNAAKASLFDVDPDTKMMNAKLPGALSITNGLTIVSEIDATGQLGKMLSPFGISKAKVLLEFPITKGAKPSFNITGVDNSPIQVCFNALPGLSSLPTIFAGLQNSCMTIDSIDFESKTQSLSLSGSVKLDQLSADVTLEHSADSTTISIASSTPVSLSTFVPLDGLPSLPILNTIKNLSVTITKLDITTAGNQTTFDLSGTASVDLLGDVEIDVSKTASSYTVSIQAKKLALNALYPALSKLDDFAKLSDLDLVLTNIAHKDAVGNLDTVQPGITVQGTITPTESLVNQMFTDSGLDSVSLKAYVPATATSFKDVKLSLDLNENPDTGFCPANAITTLISSQNPDLGQQFGPIASMLCLFTDAGIAFNPETGDMALYVSGNVNKNPAQHGMLKIWKDSSGTKFAFGAALGSINISSLLKSVQMPDFIQLQNPFLLFTNAAKASLFDVDPDTKMMNAKLPGALSITNGLTIVSEVDATGQLGTMLSPFGISKAKVLLEFPITKGAKPSFNITSVDNSPLQVCFNTLPGLSSLPTIFAGLQNSCMTIDSIDFESKTKSLSLSGSVKLDQLSADVTLEHSTDSTTISIASSTPVSLSTFVPLDGLPNLPVINTIKNLSVTITKLDITTAGNQTTFDLSGTASVDLLGDVEIDISKTASSYTVSIQAKKLALNALYPALSKLDDFAKLSDLDLVLTNVAHKDAVGNLDKVQPGITIQGTITPTESLVNQMFTDSGLDSVSLKAYVPANATNFKDVKLSLDLNENPDTGFCPLRAGQTALAKLGLTDISSQISDIISLICLFTDAGIIMDPHTGDIGFYVTGKPKGGSISLGNNAMLKLWKSGSKNQMALGIELGDQFALSTIDSSLKFLDFVKLKNPVLALTNADQANLFDVNPETKQVDATLPGIINIRNGISIISQLDTSGALGSLLAPLQAQNLRLQISIPFKKNLSSSDVQVSLTRTDQQPTTICMSKLIGTLPSDINQQFNTLLKTIHVPDLCLTTQAINVNPSAEGTTLSFKGAVSAGSQTLSGTVVITAPKDGGAIRLAIAAQTDNDYNLNDILPINQVLNITLHKPQFILATGDIKDPLLGPDTIHKGASINGSIEFGTSGPLGFMGNVLNILQFNNVMATVTIPGNPADIDGYAISAQKKLGQSQQLGNQMQIKGLSFTFKPSVPPTLSLAIDTVFTMPGSSSPISLMISGAISGPEFSLTGSAKCLDQQGCPSLDLGKIFPVKIQATPDLPLLIKLHFVGGAPVGFGGGGTAQLLNKNIKMLFDIDPVHPTKSGIKGQFDKLCLTDMINLYTTLFGQSLGFNLNLPDVFCISNAKLSVAQDTIKIDDLVIKPGLRIDGQLSLDPLPVNGSVHIAIIPPSLSALANVGEIGLTGTAELQPINIGNFIIVSSATDPSKGPIVDIHATPSKQGIKLSGLVNIGNIIKQSADLTVDSGGLSFATQRAFPGLDSSLVVTIPLSSKPEASLAGEMTILGAKGTVSGLISPAGLIATAELQPINVGNFITISNATDQNKGPSAKIRITAKEQNVTLSGLVKIGNFIKESADLTLGPSGLSFTTKQGLAGVDAALTVTIPLVAKPEASLAGTINVLGAQGTITGLISPKGLTANAALNPINIDNFIKVSSTADQNKGPSININATTSQQGITLSGLVNIGDIIKQSADLTLDSSGLSFKTDRNIAGIDTSLVVTIPIGSNPQALVAGNISVFGANGTVSGIISSGGITLTGQLPPLTIGNVIKVASKIGSGGPTITISSKTNQAIIDGIISIGNIINNSGTITLAPGTLSIDTSIMLAGIKAAFNGKAQIGKESNMAVTLTVTNGLNDLVKSNITNILTNQANSTFSSVTGGIESIKSKCSSLPPMISDACSGLLSQAENGVTIAQTALNTLTQAFNNLSVNIDSVNLSGSLGMDAGSPKLGGAMSGTVNYTIAGQKGSINITVDPNDPVSLVTAIAKELLNPTKAITDFDNQIKKIGNAAALLKNLLENVGNLIANAMKNMAANLGKYAATLGTDAIQAMGTVTQQLGSIVGDIGHIGDQIANDIGKLGPLGEGTAAGLKLAISATSDAAQVAQLAAQEAQQLVSSAVKEVEKAIEQAIAAVQEVIQEIGKAVTAAVEELGSIAKKVFCFGGLLC